MRYVKIIFGMIHMCIISILSCGNISFKLPVRLDNNAHFGRRRHGKILLGNHVSINTNAHLAVTENASIAIGDYRGIGDNNVIVARQNFEI